MVFVRLKPPRLTTPEFMLCLQGGKFDQPDRLFNSVAETWDNVLTGHADVKELIPEFFQSSGEFLINSQGLPLGVKQDKTKVMDVELPPYAKGNLDVGVPLLSDGRPLGPYLM
ncbi:protein FAN-like [Actinia tenebrosa]|uniref:Protein FAN-like n=1 Tax=Actinia tenebrosa TaxID=6105 RepID=A0A6P8HS43_ACTTE|nr:protein FAN-like [Actinia tenebrosa]